MFTADEDDDDAAFFTRKNKISAHKDVGLLEQYCACIAYIKL